MYTNNLGIWNKHVHVLKRLTPYSCGALGQTTTTQRRQLVLWKCFNPPAVGWVGWDQGHAAARQLTPAVMLLVHKDLHSM